MSKPIELKTKDGKLYRVTTEQRDPSFPQHLYVIVNKVTVNGREEWVGTSIWSTETKEWRTWQKLLPVTKSQLEQELHLKEASQ